LARIGALQPRFAQGGQPLVLWVEVVECHRAHGAGDEAAQVGGVEGAAVVVADAGLGDPCAKHGVVLPDAAEARLALVPAAIGKRPRLLHQIGLAMHDGGPPVGAAVGAQEHDATTQFAHAVPRQGGQAVRAGGAVFLGSQDELTEDGEEHLGGRGATVIVVQVVIDVHRDDLVVGVQPRLQFGQYGGQVALIGATRVALAAGPGVADDGALAACGVEPVQVQFQDARIHAQLVRHGVLLVGVLARQGRRIPGGVERVVRGVPVGVREGQGVLAGA
jgi:hypothetical protein